MPTVLEPSTVSSTQHFRREFLAAGGLNLVCRVLRRDFLPLDVNYETRQGCCLIALQLARFLLCGQVDEAASSTAVKMATTPSKLQLTPTKMTPIKISPIRQTTPIKIQMSPSKLQQSAPPAFAYSPIKENTETARAAIQVLQTLSETEFLDMVSCFMRVCWAAAAGKLHLAAAPASTSSSQANKDVSGASSDAGAGIAASLFNAAGRRSRQSSTGSTSSTGSAGDADGGGLYFGICASQQQLCSKDLLIACEALELLVTCLEVRGAKELASFYHLHHVKGTCLIIFFFSSSLSTM